MSQSERIVSLKDLIDTNNVRFGTSGARGLVVDMTNDVCFAYTLAFLDTVNIEPLSRVALAIDLRPSSPHIAAVCAAAVTAPDRIATSASDERARRTSAYLVPFSHKHLTSERSALAIARSLARAVEKLQLRPKDNPWLIA